MRKMMVAWVMCLTAATAPVGASATPAKFEGACAGLKGTGTFPGAVLQPVTLKASGGTCTGTLTRSDGVAVSMMDKQVEFDATRLSVGHCQAGGGAAQAAASAGSGALTFVGVYPNPDGTPGNETLTFDVDVFAYAAGQFVGVLKGGSEAGYPVGTQARVAGTYARDCSPPPDAVELSVETGPSLNTPNGADSLFVSTTG